MEYAGIILEMLDRIKKLEKDVSELKKVAKSEIKDVNQQNNSADMSVKRRDNSRYLFEGNIYLKNRLVLAVVKSYLANNTLITRNELKQVFNKSLQGSIGVVEDVEIAKRRADYNIRFFTKENEVLQLIDGEMYVCTQWGILNLPYFLAKAETLGFKIEKVDS